MTQISEENDCLQVSPSELNFRFQLGKNVPAQLILYNPTNGKYAFKIKTTSPKKYCVRPAAGFVVSQGSKQIEVIMQSQKEFPSDIANCKDKFLLQMTPVMDSDDAITNEMFDKEKNQHLKEKKMKVTLETPHPPPTIEEQPEEENKEVNGLTIIENKEDDVPGDREELLKTIKTLETEIKDLTTRTQVKHKPIVYPLGHFSLIHLLATAILCFFCGCSIVSLFSTP